MPGFYFFESEIDTQKNSMPWILRSGNTNSGKIAT